MTTRPVPPVLLLIFNRPDSASVVFERIRRVKPGVLCVAGDGPRPGVPGEEEKCRRARELVNEVDWPCEVRTLFRDENLGLRTAVSGAITWFFEMESEGIILEDDCVPSTSFFPFCSELLERYREKSEIMAISGVNFQFGAQKTPHSYYFSRYNHCWGWAGWRRSWKYYDNAMSQWSQARVEGTLDRVLQDREAARYWTEAFDKAFRGEVDSWAYRWTLSTWLAGGLAILPSVNLVSNIGFDDDATHTRGKSPIANMSAEEIDFPLHHPPHLEVDVEADRRTFEKCYKMSLKGRVRAVAGRLKACLRGKD